MSNTCQNCRYWRSIDDVGECISEEAHVRIRNLLSYPLTTDSDFGCIFFADKASSVSPSETSPAQDDQESPSDHPKFPGTKVLTKEHLIRVMGEQKAAALFKQLNI